jgi:myosin heavy subunit
MPAVKLSDTIKRAKDFKEVEYIWFKEDQVCWVETTGDVSNDDLVVFHPCKIKSWDGPSLMCSVKPDGGNQ